MKKILFFAMVLFSINSRAQTNIGIYEFGPTPANDTVLAGSSATYNVWVKNYGPGTFSDNLYITTALRDSTFTGLDSLDNYLAGTLTILPGDSTLVTLTADYTVSPVGYRYGIDVIVIWPFATSATTVDSLEFSVYILDPSGNNELNITQLIKIYPNPSVGQISIDNKTGVSVESIRIFDLSGKLILTNRGQNTINTETLKPGMYQADVILADKKHHTFKIIKQKKPSE